MNGNPFASCYRGDLSQDEILMLISIKQNLIRISQNPKLRQFSSQRNKKINDPVLNGSLIHGIREYKLEVLDSILNNGIVCSEFLGKIEDGETFFHADFIESNKTGIIEWQYSINSAPSTFPRTIFRRLRDFMPSIHTYNQRIALIVNRSPSQSWNRQQESMINNVKSRFIKSIPIPYSKEGPNQVSILGGVASTDVYGIIVSHDAMISRIIKILNKNRIYIPLFGAEGGKLF